MSQMDSLGLPEAVVDMIKRQSQGEGLELEWHIGGNSTKVELKLVWRPARGPRRDYHSSKPKYKSPGNLKRDNIRMKQMLVDINSVAVGTDDLEEMTSVDRPNAGHSHDTCVNESPICAPVHKQKKDEQFILKSKSGMRETKAIGVRTRQMAKYDDVENIRAEEDMFNLSDSYHVSTPVKCDNSMSTISNDLDSPKPELAQSTASFHGLLQYDYHDHCLQTCHVDREESVAEGDLATVTIQPVNKQKPPDKMTATDLIACMKNMFAETRQELKDHMNNAAL